jgi:hypothetical protein
MKNTNIIRNTIVAGQSLSLVGRRSPGLQERWISGLQGIWVQRLLNGLLMGLVMLLPAMEVMGQVPTRFNQQAVVRDTTGQVVANRPLRLRISLEQTAGGASVVRYREVHQVTTNANGLYSVEVGGGAVELGQMDSVRWELGSVYLKTEVDPSGGQNYILSSNRELLSVPYALYSAKAQNAQTAQSLAGGGGGSGTLATVRTVGVTEVMYTVARVEASLDASGGEFVVSKGFCVDTLAVPTVDNGIAVAGGGLGAFELALNSLEPGRMYYVRAFATTASGTAYGQVLSFQTRALAVPAPTTEAASGVGAFGAQLLGSLADTASGGMALTARGFRWSQTAGFASASGQDIPAQATAGQGFSAQLQGLTASTTYYYRAYASNALGTGYGAENSFTTGTQPLPTVQTQAASAITQTTASVAGAVTADAGAAVTVRGFCYSTNNNPLISNDTVQAGAGLGTFSATLRNLSAGSTYYFRAFAVNAGGVGYGLVQSFQTPALATATITTNPVYGISNQSAYSGGNISSDGGSAVTQRGVAFGTSANPTTAGSITSNGTGVGSYTSIMAGLTPSTTYYVRSYAINASGTAYGQERSFQTTAQASGPVTVPILGTQFVVKTDSNFIGGGNITSDGNSTITSLGICWNRTGMPTLSDSVVYFATPGLGSFDLPFQLPTGCNENFYIRAFAVNVVGVGYGQEVSTANGYVSKFGGISVSNITGTGATVEATILSDGGCPVLERGVCFSIAPNATNGNPFFTVQSGIGIGTFSCQLNLLRPEVTYYCRAYVITTNGTYFGPEVTFTTDTTSALYIGKPFAGGIIFDLDSTGQHGLVCTPSNLGNYPWGCRGTIIANTSTALGAGATNTAFIIAACAQRPIAASVCADLVLNGYSDWFLPSLNELQLMYSRLYLQYLGGFVGWKYWSSSQAGPYSVFGFNFSSGFTYDDLNSEDYVRAVRAF